MNRRTTWSITAVIVVGLALISNRYLLSATDPVPAETAQGVRRGVSLSGAEFGTDKPGFSNMSPGVFGRDYTYNSERSMEAFRQQGITLFRLPIRWERIQPQLGEPLDELELARLKVAVGWAKRQQSQVIIDLHNYGRYVLHYEGRPRAFTIDQTFGSVTPVTKAHFADLWQRLAVAFRDETGIDSFGLMNEPHDMGKSDWKAISQAAVDAIRSTGDRHRILVAGDGWSKCQQFEQVNGASAWIRDPADNFAYEAHCYLDRDGSGRYAMSFDEEQNADPEFANRPENRLRAFAEWCSQNHVQGYIGEFGVPAGDARWQSLLKRAVEGMDRSGLEGCHWGGGEWWGDHPLSVQPKASFREPSASMKALRR